MLKRDYEGQNCSVARALEVVGERWTLLIVRDASLGLTRFEQFQASLGIARNVLADRLGRLVDAGILKRVRLSEQPPRLLRRKADDKLVVAALVPEDAAVLRADEVELVPGPGA
jgi:DNA-binding HxlR family transcriptional regulator